MSKTDIAGSSFSVSSFPPEIWTLIAEEIHGPQTLEALTRVCRAFRDIFTPFLNKRCVVRLNRCRTADLDQKPLPAGVRYTKDLEILLLEFSRDHPYNIEMNESYALFIVRMLRAMPHIRSFRWLDASFENGYNPCQMLKHPELLPTLKKSQTLRELSIQFTSQCLDEEGDEEPVNVFVSLKGFSNLTSLELYGFYGEQTHVVKEIASLLKDLPTLKALGLGMLYPCDPSRVSEVLILNGGTSFFEDLCLEYHSQRDSMPLALETLRLGHGMFLYKQKRTSPDNYLTKMVKVEGLKTFHIWNGWVRFSDDDDEDAMPWRIDFTLLNGCESLRELSVTRLSSHVRRWLNGPGKSVEELKVTDHYSMYDRTLNNFNKLKLPHLTTIFTREVTVEARDSQNEWSDLDSSDSDMEDSDMEDYGSGWVIPSFPRRKRLDRNTITVLDRLYDGGAQLSRIGICFNFDTQWKQFSSHLPNLKNLTQLSLQSRSQKSGQYPSKASSLWPDVERPKQIAIRYAKLAKSMCPSLQYIQIRRWAWQVTIPPGSSCDKNEEIFDQVQLRQLELEETLAMELFAVDTFTTQSGLTGPEYPYEEESEEEDMRIQRLFDSIDLAISEGMRDPAEIFAAVQQNIQEN